MYIKKFVFLNVISVLFLDRRHLSHSLLYKIIISYNNMPKVRRSHKQYYAAA